MSIVLGYDQSPGARSALSVAIDLAHRFDEPLVLVHGVAPPGGIGDELSAHRDALMELARPLLAQALEAATAAGVETTIEMVAVKPALALTEVADRHDARMIVVGTWGESPLRGAVLGSTPHKLLHLSERPVLCVPAAR